MPTKPRKVGRPAQAATSVIRIPANKKNVVEKVIGYEIVTDQTPHLMVRVPTAKVKEIRKQLKKG